MPVLHNLGWTPASCITRSIAEVRSEHDLGRVGRVRAKQLDARDIAVVVSTELDETAKERQPSSVCNRPMPGHTTAAIRSPDREGADVPSG